MKTIKEYNIEVHGLDFPDYFPGAGLAFTDYDDIATGIGNSEREALEDALEQLAQGDWDTSAIDKDADDTDQVEEWADEQGIDDVDEIYDWPNVYVTVRVK